MRPAAPRPGRAVAACLGTIAVLLTGCSSTPAARALPSAPADLAAAGGRVPQIAIVPQDGSANVPLDRMVTVSADVGSLDVVALHAAGDTTALDGELSHDRRTWTATTALDPGVSYVVEASAHGPGGDESSARATFTTLPAVNRLTTDVSPSDGATVGVGMPIKLHFNADVAPEQQSALVQHITVTTTPATNGGWHWFAPNEVHWRPENYWQPGTQVTVTADLRGVNAGNNVWGLGSWSSHFTIGEKHVTTIDAATHQMTVTRNDQTVYTFPVSTGRPRNPTLSGTLVVWYKQYDVLMDSQTIGIPRTSPDGYYEHVYWDTAISTDGFFIHSAPWSEWAQGSTNVSHGCVNLSPARAEEFYNFSQPGDVVVVSNTSRTADASDGEGDWQIPFAQYANSGAGATPAPPAQPGGI